VTPYELMKIRLLNGSHSALSYISYLLGYRHVDDAMADSEVRRFVERYMREIEPAVGEVPGVDLREYQEKLVERFSNPAIRDQVLRLCEDGSRKIPNMMLEPMAELLSGGSSVSHGAFAIAAWIRFLQGVDDNGEAIPIKDPNGERLQSAAKECEEDISPFIGLEFVFPARLRQNTQFSREVLTWFLSLKNEGARQAIRAFLEKS
jgi:mannitol 2-dehydrogenase